MSDWFVAVGIPVSWCNSTASFRLVKVDNKDLRPTTLWMRVFLCVKSLVFSKDSLNYHGSRWHLGSGWRRASPMEWAVAPLIATTQWRGDVETARKTKSEMTEQDLEHILADGWNLLSVASAILNINCVVPLWIYRFEARIAWKNTPKQLCSSSKPSRRQWLSSDVGAGGSSNAA